MVERRKGKRKLPRRGKGKGQQFEREVCVKFSLWVTDGKQKDCFWRSAMSGGRATVSRGQVRQAGDITAVSSEGYELVDMCYFELKFYKSLNIQLFLLHGGGPLALFWNQTVRQADHYNRHPVLIAKENNEEPLVIVSREASHFIGPFTDDDLPSIDAVEANCRIFKLADILARPYPWRKRVVRHQSRRS